MAQHDKQISFRIDSDLHKRFHKWCVENDTKMTLWIRQQIKKVVSKGDNGKN
jgi:hypothetical protein